MQEIFKTTSRFRATLTSGLLVLGSLVILQTQLINSASAEVTFLNSLGDGGEGSGDGEFYSPTGVALSDTGSAKAKRQAEEGEHLSRAEKVANGDWNPQDLATICDLMRRYATKRAKGLEPSTFSLEG